ANRSGRPSPTTAEHVYADLRGRVELVLDGGPAGVGVESTVLDVSGERPILLRPGGLPLEELRRVVGEVLLDPGLEGRGVLTPKAPGLKYVHYAPRAPLVLIAPRPGTPPSRLAEAAWQAVAEALAATGESPGPAGLLAFDENLPAHRAAARGAGLQFTLGELDRRAPRGCSGVLALSAGPADEPAQTAARLFAALRWFDQAGVRRRIVAEGTQPAGLGFAVANRLRKAAGEIREV
ncbi:MAG: L-threonylcarbamoyladenylate synthase, partial [Chitinophagales bacterium]